jgi:hypothetical protein
VSGNGFAKEGRVPASDIDKAVERKKKFEDNPEPHMAIWEKS